MDSDVQTSAQSDDYDRDLAILDWLVEMGADEAICEAGINRYKLPATTPVAAKSAQTPQPEKTAATAAAPVQNIVQTASIDNLEELRATIETFDGCAAKQGARNTVFASGNQNAKVMIIGDIPDRDEDRTGIPFSGQAGLLLDKMLAAINLSKDSEKDASAVYLANIFPWRSRQNLDSLAADILLMKPFLLRHIALVRPDILVLMGNTASKTLLETKNSITKTRGQWHHINGIPAISIFHPSYLLRTPAQKRLAWADLLAIQTKLNGA